MERNDSFGAGSTGQGNIGGTTGAGDFGGSNVGSAAGSQGFADSTVGGGTGSTATSDRIQNAKNVASDKLNAVKEKAGNLSSTLADRLEAGAEKLRQRNQANQLAGVDGGTVGANDQMSALTNRLAGGLQGTADALRNPADLKGSIETQVRENPARTLLIAVGVGYLLGKAFKKQ